MRFPTGFANKWPTVYSTGDSMKSYGASWGTHRGSRKGRVSYLSRYVMIIKEFTMNDAKVAVESHKEWLTLSKSDVKVQNQVIGCTAKFSNVIPQGKWAEHFIGHIKQKKEPKSCGLWEILIWTTVLKMLLSK